MPVTRAELKKLKSLNTVKGRKSQGKFLAEGARLLEEALRCRRLPLEVYAATARATPRATGLLENFRSAGVPLREVSTRQLQSVASVATSQGVIGVFRIPADTRAELFGSSIRRAMVCDGISDPGNLGTLIRSAAAFEFDCVLLTGSTADPYSPKVVRATAGAHFATRIGRTTKAEIFRLVAKRHLTLIAAASHGEGATDRLTQVAKSGRILIAVGSEATGLSPDIVERSDLVWRIRHSKNVESLNAAVAGSIIMKQVYDASR